MCFYNDKSPKGSITAVSLMISGVSSVFCIPLQTNINYPPHILLLDDSYGKWRAHRDILLNDGHQSTLAIRTDRGPFSTSLQVLEVLRVCLCVCTCVYLSPPKVWLTVFYSHRPFCLSLPFY